MAEQDLHGAKITRCLVDQCRLGPSHRVCAIFSFVEADRRYPFVDKASILSCAQVTKVIDPDLDQIAASQFAVDGEIV